MPSAAPGTRPRSARTLARKAKPTPFTPIAGATLKGRVLARELAPWLVPPTAPESAELIATCSKIAMLASKHLTIAIHECNRSLLAGEQERSDAIELEIRALVTLLPASADGPLSVRFDGDPRGYVCKVHVPGDTAKHHGNTWGQGGDYGVGEYQERA